MKQKYLKKVIKKMVEKQMVMLAIVICNKKGMDKKGCLFF